MKTKAYEFPVKNQKIMLFRNEQTHETVIIKNGQISQIKHELKTKNVSLIAAIDVEIDQKHSRINFNFIELNASFIPQGSLKELISLTKEKPGLIVSNEVDELGCPKGYNLKVGSVIVIGRAKLLVKETRIGGKVEKMENKIENYLKEVDENEIHESILSEECQIETESHSKILSHTSAYEQNSIKSKQPQNQEQEESNKCKICFGDNSTSDNPLISPCHCSGSCRYIHADCLQRWIEFKSVVHDRKFCITIEKINCEICKAELPLDLEMNGKKCEYEIIKRPIDEDYILIERIECSVKTIFILRNFPHEGISLGRDNSCYIKIEDISVSRVHSYIHYNEGKFRIVDNHSKFGTCVKESPFVLDVGKTPRGVQIGRSIIQISIKKVENQILPLEI